MHPIKQYEFYYKLRTLPFVEQIWLYGSRASGQEAPRSDMDLALVCPQATPQEWQQILEIIETADTLLKIDCLRLDILQDQRLKREIEHTKIILFKRVPNSYGWYEIFLDLGEALEKFHHILELDTRQIPYITEATIQIFEYTFELYWKLLKKICRQEGVEVNSPRSTLQQAYAMGLIQNERLWLEIMEDRNLTSHTYKFPTASTIYEHCKVYEPLMSQTYRHLKEKFGL